MFIKEIKIKNFRLFQEFELSNLNVPDKENYGSGLNVFIGENGTGKTSLLDAIALTLLNYKAETFSIDDLNNVNENTNIELYANEAFKFDSVLPKKGKISGIGFSFKAGIRKQENYVFFPSIVTYDRRFIPSEKKLDKNSVELRVDVNNPWSGSRYKDNEVLYLDKNRTYQIRSGIYNQTRFDRIMEAFDYWYIKEQHKKQHGIEYDLNQKLKDEISKSNLHKEIKDVFKKFKKICGFDLDLIYINNYRPHLNCFFAKIKENKQPIKLSNLGSGYEMIFSLLYSFNISNKIKKDLIILIDEPEIHQHPRLLKKTVDILFKYSKHAQVFITTHSSLFVKYLFQKFGRYYKEDKDNKVKNCIKILKRNNSSDSINDLFLPYFSSNEINYVAFDLVTEEYFNEIYEELKYIYDQKNNKISSYKDFDEKYFIQGKKAKRKHPYKNESESVSIYTYIRNQIHHPKEYKKYGTLKNEKLRKSILNLRKFLRNERKR